MSALREQTLLKARVVDRDTEAWQRDPAFSGLQRVGGVDVSFVKGDSASACASLVVLSYPELEVTRGPPARPAPGWLWDREPCVLPGSPRRRKGDGAKSKDSGTSVWINAGFFR